MTINVLPRFMNHSVQSFLHLELVYSFRNNLCCCDNAVVRSFLYRPRDVHDCSHVIMVALCNRADHNIFIL